MCTRETPETPFIGMITEEERLLGKTRMDCRNPGSNTRGQFAPVSNPSAGEDRDSSDWPLVKIPRL